jgi:hypothetical protein
VEKCSTQGHKPKNNDKLTSLPTLIGEVQKSDAKWNANKSITKNGSIPNFMLNYRRLKRNKKAMKNTADEHIP